MNTLHLVLLNLSCRVCMLLDKMTKLWAHLFRSSDILAMDIFFRPIPRFPEQTSIPVVQFLFGCKIIERIEQLFIENV